MRKHFLAGFLSLCLLLPLSGCAKNPATGQQELSFMDKQDEIKIGKKHYPLMTQMNEGELKGERLQNYVSKMGHQLAEVSHRPDLPYEFNVVNSSTPNAYALPGGFVSVTRGLLFEMNSEGELAAVIGHEIAHATARHTAQRQTSGILTQLGMIGLNIYLQKEGVSNPDLWMQGGKIVAGAGMASYSRSQEQQADQLGIEYMAKAGYDPEGMVDLQKTLLKTREQRPNFLQKLFSTHPLSEDRIKDSRKQIEQIKQKVDIPRSNQLNQFNEVVLNTWNPRKPAYAQMDSGIEHVKSDKYNNAEQHFRNAINIYSGEPLFHTWLGKALDEQGQSNSARQHHDRALGLTKDVFRIRLFSGINRFNLDNYQASLNELEQAEELLPNFPDTKFYRGRNHEELGHREKAAEYYYGYLKQVKEGEKAQYAYNRLKQWNYI